MISSFRGSSGEFDTTSDHYYKDLIFNVRSDGSLQASFNGIIYYTSYKLIKNTWYHVMFSYKYLDKLNNDNNARERHDYGSYNIYINRQRAKLNVLGDYYNDPLTLETNNSEFQIGRLCRGTNNNNPSEHLRGHISDLYLTNYDKEYIYFPLRNNLKQNQFFESNYSIESSSSAPTFENGCVNINGSKFLKLDNSLKSSFFNNRSFSISCYVSFDKLNNENYLFKFGTENQNGKSMLIYRLNKIILFNFLGSISFVKLTDEECVIDSNKFIHISFVYKLGVGKKIYINGIERTSEIFDEIRVRHEKKEYLHIAEVEVHDNNGNNLCRTLSGNASKIDAYGGADKAAEKAVDGNTSGIWSSNKMTSTGNPNNPWWKYKWNNKININTIQNVKVYNRTDCCKNRLNDAIIEFRMNDEIVYNVGKYSGSANNETFDVNLNPINPLSLLNPAVTY